MRKHRWFPFWRREDPAPDTDAIEAMDEAVQGLTEAKAQQAHAQSLAIQLRAMRHRNHFGAAIEHAYRGNNHA